MISRDSTETDIKNEAIKLCIALLLGGNKQCQQAFYDYMISRKNNLFYISIKKMVHEAFF